MFVFFGHGWSDGAENYLVLADALGAGSAFQIRPEGVVRGKLNTVFASFSFDAPTLI